MNTTRLQIKKIEKQIVALEAEAAALLNGEMHSETATKQIRFAIPKKRQARYSTLKAPAQLH